MQILGLSLINSLLADIIGNNTSICILVVTGQNMLLIDLARYYGNNLIFSKYPNTQIIFFGPHSFILFFLFLC